MVYNQYPNSDKLITQDSERIIESQLKTYFPKAAFVSVPEIDLEEAPLINFQNIKF